MLDLAFGLSDTCVLRGWTLPDRARALITGCVRRSRLGCQVHLTKDMEGMVATLPSATRNM